MFHRLAQATPNLQHHIFAINNLFFFVLFFLLYLRCLLNYAHLFLHLPSMYNMCICGVQFIGFQHRPPALKAQMLAFSLHKGVILTAHLLLSFHNIHCVWSLLVFYDESSHWRSMGNSLPPLAGPITRRSRRWCRWRKALYFGSATCIAEATH